MEMREKKGEEGRGKERGEGGEECFKPCDFSESGLSGGKQFGIVGGHVLTDALFIYLLLRKSSGRP